MSSLAARLDATYNPRRRQRADGLATMQRVLSEAELAFGAEGFEEARLSVIASRAGVARSTVLHHFPTKHALYACVIETAFSRLGESLAIQLDGTDPVDVRVARALTELVAFFEERPSFARILLRATLADDQRVVIDGIDALMERLSGVVVRGDLRARLAAPGPLRAAVLHVASAAVMRASASGPLRAALWQGIEATHPLLSTLLIPSLDRLS